MLLTAITLILHTGLFSNLRTSNRISYYYMHPNISWTLLFDLTPDPRKSSQEQSSKKFDCRFLEIIINITFHSLSDFPVGIFGCVILVVLGILLGKADILMCSV